MNLSEAYYLATVIRTSCKAELMAIGRFLPVEQLAGADRWGCSVLFADGRKLTVWSIAEWCKLVDPLSHDSPSRDAFPIHDSESRATKETPPRPDAKHRNQLSLF